VTSLYGLQYRLSVFTEMSQCSMFVRSVQLGTLTGIRFLKCYSQSSSKYMVYFNRYALKDFVGYIK